MDFEARIGERFHVAGTPIHWDPHADSEWVARLRQARGTASATPATGMPASGNAFLENVSVSGAGVRAPAEARCVVHTSVSVSLTRECSFEAVIRRILPADEVGWAYFGVEFTTISPSFARWLDQVIQTQRSKQRN